MKTDVKRESIARKVTRRTSLWLFAALFVLLLSSFFMISRFVFQKTLSLNKTIVAFYSDFVTYLSKQSDVPIDTEHPDISVSVSEYLCEWYSIDYAYMYIPDFENGRRVFINVTDNAGRDVIHVDDDHMNGYTKEYTFSDEEKAMWRQEQLFAYVHDKNEFGNEFCVRFLVMDGNDMPVAIAGVDISYFQMIGQILLQVLLYGLIFAAVIFAVRFAIAGVIKREVSRPAQALCRSMNAYLSDDTHTVVEYDGGGTGEFAEIAEAFSGMTRNIDAYIANIHALTDARSRQQTELNIASRIQQGYLPPAFFLGKECDIHARMTPAKDVGGDLYDYLPLDDRRTLVVIADVSGKGISGAFFMAITLTLIRQYAKMGISPAEILRRTNDSLCANNPAMLFATAFVGIYDGADRTVTFANAGHNPPYIVGEKLRTLESEPCTMLGLFENEDYTEQTVPMAIGETLFLFTDGVNEAVNEQKRFFGEKRLEDALLACRKTHKEDPVNYIFETVKAFAGNAEQHDDITVLTLTAAETKELWLDFDVGEFPKLKETILSLTLSRQRQLDLCLAAEECFVNICSYAFEDGVPEGEKIHVVLIVSDRVTVRFEDGGKPFDPLANTAAPDDYDIDTQIGGLGTFLAFASVNDAKYEYRDNKNILTLIKYFEEDDPS